MRVSQVGKKERKGKKRKEKERKGTKRREKERKGEKKKEKKEKKEDEEEEEVEGEGGEEETSRCERSRIYPGRKRRGQVVKAACVKRPFGGKVVAKINGSKSRRRRKYKPQD
jgi:hypothetical protein